MKLTLCVLGMAVVSASFASTIRHDRNDTDYQNLGNSFVSVGLVTTNSGLGSGTYIGFGNGFHWAITAAHVTGNVSENPMFHVNSMSIGVGQVIQFSGWGLNNNDFTLLRLNSNPGVAAMPFYNGSGELGNMAISVGFGATGNGNTGINSGAGTKRGFENTIDQVTTSGSQNVLFSDFDSGLAGDNFMGTVTQRNLEGCVAGGDSGGGLFMNVGSAWTLVGVTSTLNWADGSGNADYGDISGYSRIGGSTPTGANWITSNTGIQGVPEPGTMIALGAGALALARRRRNS